MKPARAFELADRQPKATEIVTGHAHAAVNVMARGGPQDRAKLAIGEVREMCGEFRRLTFGLLPFTLEYDPAMSEDALRAWAADLVAVLRDGG